MYHKKARKVAQWNEELGQSFVPEKDNAWKFELYVHNVLPLIEKSKFGLLEIERESEYAPIKNAPGNEEDSPDTARELMSELHKKYFALAGGDFDGEGDFEIDAMVTYEGEGLEAFVKEDQPVALPGFLCS